MDSSAFLLNPLDPPELRDSADQMEDECLLLTADQAELLNTFRKDVRFCETDEEKFPYARRCVVGYSISILR